VQKHIEKWFEDHPIDTETDVITTGKTADIGLFLMLAALPTVFK
jgi:hypothetical protein